MAEKNCVFYLYENEDGDYVHDKEDDNGFCILKSLFSRCTGKCSDFEQINEVLDAEA